MSAHDHHVDPASGALIFPRNPVVDVMKANAVLQAKLDSQGALLAALLAALPKTTLDKIPTELMEAGHAD